MLGRTHIALGMMMALLFVGVLSSSSPVADFNVVALGLGILGALLPDLDMGTSSLAGKFGILKARHIKKIWMALMGVFAIGTFLFLRETPFFLGILFILFLGFLFSDGFAQRGYYALRNFVQAMVALLIIGWAYYYDRLPIAWIGVILLLLLFSKHRGLSHSIIFIIGVTWVAKGVSLIYSERDYSIIVGVSMLSHVVGDMFTKAGVTLFWPLSKKRIRFPVTIKTGGWIENLIFVGACIGVFQLMKIL